MSSYLFIYAPCIVLRAALICTPCELALLAWALLGYSFVYTGRDGRPLWELLPFLKSLVIVLSLYYYQYYRTVPVIILVFALFLLPLYNIRIVQVPS